MMADAARAAAGRPGYAWGERQVEGQCGGAIRRRALSNVAPPDGRRTKRPVMWRQQFTGAIWGHWARYTTGTSPPVARTCPVPRVRG